MERQPIEKQKVNWDSLTEGEKIIYYDRASDLIERGYIQDRELDELARQIYESKWRVFQ